MKRFMSVLIVVSVTVLAGCAVTPPITNASGQPIKHISPVLGKSSMADARFVLIEKNIADGKYGLVSISKTRQPIANERQERIAFNKDLTGFATDYAKYELQTYTDEGNYGQETVIMRCQSYPKKVQEYSPCSSSFASVFVPMGITKAYVAGRMSMDAKNRWENPAQNNMRKSDSPLWALRQAGVFERMSELANPN